MGGHSRLDAIIIADSGDDSLSATSPFKLKLDGREADIQVVKNYVKNNGRVTQPIEGDNEASWSSAPKLNGIFLYSYLTANSLNVALIHNYTKERESFQNLLSEKPKSVVISTPFIFFKDALRELVNDIRSLAPDIFIIAGGAFVHYSYLLLQRVGESDYETDAARNDFLFLKIDDEPDIDLYITSPRGEDILCRALQRMSDGDHPHTLENSAWIENGAYVFSGRIDDVTNSPMPRVDWNNLPDSFYSKGVIPIQASNGCPYNCSFCNFTKDRRLTFVKPIETLVTELKTVEKRGIRYVWFVDDNFRLGRDDLNEVCERFIAEDIRLQWMCFIRASTLASTDLDLLRQAGCIELQIGLESGDPVILDNMNKKADPVMYSKVIGDVLQRGINVSCYFISGFPGETAATARTTRNFIKSIEHPEYPGSLSWSIYPFILSPLSPVYEPDMRKKYGLTGYLHKWTHKTMNYQEARKEVLNSFLELKLSGPIYRGDNLNFLRVLPDKKRKNFFRIRNALAKKSLQTKLEPAEIISSFANIL